MLMKIWLYKHGLCFPRAVVS